MVQCMCGEILPRDKNVLRRHEARAHEYNAPQYTSYVPKKLSKKEFDEIVKRGEVKFQHALIVPNESSNTAGYGQNDNTMKGRN